MAAFGPLVRGGGTLLDSCLVQPHNVTAPLLCLKPWNDAHLKRYRFSRSTMMISSRRNDPSQQTGAAAQHGAATQHGAAAHQGYSAVVGPDLLAHIRMKSKTFKQVLTPMDQDV